MLEILRPCPWCGGHDLYVSPMDPYDVETLGAGTVQCNNEHCGAEGPFDSRADEVELARRWNQREATILTFGPNAIVHTTKRGER